MRYFSQLAIACLVIAPALASAQIGLGLAAGASFPVGTNTFQSGSYNTGYHVQATVNISPPLLPIGFRIGGSLDRFPQERSGTSTGSYRVAGLEGSIVRGLGGVPLVGPYILVGAGFYNLSTSTTVSGVTASSSTNKPGANVGAGVRAGLGGLSAYAEVGYHYISGNEGFQFAPVMVGISF